MRDIQIDALSTEELVRRCQRDLPEDPRPFEALLARFKQQVFNTAYRLMGNRHDAEDQAQLVFFKVYTSIRELDDPAIFAGWLSRITVNTCLDALRRSRRRPQAVAEVEAMQSAARTRELVSHPLTPEQMALARELRECIETTLLALDSDARTVLVLRELEDCSYQEIATLVQASLGAVKMRIHRARVAFQQLFRELCHGLWRVERA